MDPGRLRREGEIPSGPLCPGFAECIEYHAIIVTLRCWSRRSQLTRKSWISDPSSDAPGRRQHPAQRRDRLTRCSQYRVWEGLLRLQPFEDGLQRLALRRMMLAGNRKFEDLYGSFSVKFFCCGSLFGAERPFLVPSPAIRFAERAERCQGTEMLAQLSGLPLSVACVFGRHLT